MAWLQENILWQIWLITCFIIENGHGASIKRISASTAVKRFSYHLSTDIESSTNKIGAKDIILDHVYSPIHKSTTEMLSAETSTTQKSTNKMPSAELTRSEKSTNEMLSAEMFTTQKSTNEMLLDETSTTQKSTNKMLPAETFTTQKSTNEMLLDETSTTQKSTNEMLSVETSTAQKSTDEMLSVETSTSTTQKSTNKIPLEELIRTEKSTLEMISAEISTTEKSADELPSTEKSTINLSTLEKQTPLTIKDSIIKEEIQTTTTGISTTDISTTIVDATEKTALKKPATEELVTLNHMTETSITNDLPIEMLTNDITMETPLITTHSPPPPASKASTSIFAISSTYLGNILNKKKISSARLNLIEKTNQKSKKLFDEFKNKKTKEKEMNYELNEFSSFNQKRNVFEYPEIISLKTKPSMFHAILKSVKESNNFEDPFSIINGLSFGQVQTTHSPLNIVDDASSGNGLVNKDKKYKVTVKYINSTNTPTTSEVTSLTDPSDQVASLDLQKRFGTYTTGVIESILQQNTTPYQEDFTDLDKPSTESTLISENSLSESTISPSNIDNNYISFNPLSNSDSDNFLKYYEASTILKSEQVLHRLNFDDIGSEESNEESISENEQDDSKIEEWNILMEQSSKRKKEIVPIYDEISRPLHIDSSIDDIEEDEPKNPKVTENTDDYFPKINNSFVNLLEPDLKIENIYQMERGNVLDLDSSQIHFATIGKQEPSSSLPIEVSSVTSDSNNKSSFNNKMSGNVNPSPTQQHFPTSVTSKTIYMTNTTTSANNTTPHTLNSTGSNIVKDQIDMRKRPLEIKRTEVHNDMRFGINQTTKDVYNESSYPNYGFNSNWNTKTKTRQADPHLLRRHNERVLQIHAAKMLKVMNQSVNPCDDFYEYACGKWSEVYPLEDKALDNTFDRLREGLDEVLKLLLEEPISNVDTNATKAAKTLYKGCMNEEKIEEKGTYPLKELLQNLGGWPVLEGKAWNKSEFDWVELMAVLRTYNNDILLSEWVAADITNSSNNIIQIDQPELGLPGREYFLSSGDQTYRDAYLELMLKSCGLLGVDPITCLGDMFDVIEFEKQLAKILTPAEERRNLSAVHQRLTVRALEKEIPQINWELYLRIVSGNNETESVIVFAMKYIKKMVYLIDNTPKRTVSNYLFWRFVKNRISNLGQDALKAKQEFIHVLFGSKSQPERWLFCVSYVNGNLGYAVGSLFVKKYYPESSKNDSEVMIKLIRESFVETIRNATWMTKATRQVAEQKVMAMVRNVGYPQYILNDTYMNEVYSELNFDASNHFMNVIQMLQYHAQITHNLLSVPVNRNEWTTTPAVVNAYYSRSKNMIMFPAGILQPPFYHPAFPRSLNFGGIGVVIGHEISHGFDDRGRQFDATGNLKQWWTEEDVSQFYDRATCMLDQYGEYKVKSIGLKVNAVNTLGENIADNAGLKIAYKAYQRWKKQNGEETTQLPNLNLTYNQLFFLNFGQIWCEVNSPEAMLTKIRGGQHSPNRYRVIGTLSNSEEFNSAFNCQKGMKMNPENKCKVW